MAEALQGSISAWCTRHECKYVCLCCVSCSVEPPERRACHQTNPYTLYQTLDHCLPTSILHYVMLYLLRNCISFLVDLGEQFSLQPYDSTQIKYFSSIPIDIETPHDELTLVMKSGGKSYNTTPYILRDYIDWMQAELTYCLAMQYYAVCMQKLVIQLTACMKVIISIPW